MLRSHDTIRSITQSHPRGCLKPSFLGRPSREITRRGALDVLRNGVKDSGCKQRSPAPVYLRWKGVEKAGGGDLYVRTGPGSARLGAEDAAEYIVDAQFPSPPQRAI